MNTRRRRIACESIGSPGFATASLSVARTLAAAMLLAACLSFPNVALAQDSTSAAGESAASTISGVVTSADLQGQLTPIAGISVTLKGDSQGAPPPSTLTDADGRFQFDQLQAGNYLLEVSLQGFKSFTKAVVLQQKESQVQDIRLELETVSSTMEVQGQADDVTAHSSDPDTTLASKEFPSLPMIDQKYQDALPLVPGVVKTMDGTLNLKGETEQQGMLLVDSAQMVDPVTGSFSVGIPLEAIETLNVYETPYNAQYGGFSGGLASIETKAPPERWQYRLMDFVPGWRMKNGGHISGTSSWTPRLYTGGALVKNKVNISQSLDYFIKNRPIRGLPWPHDEIRTRGFTSFTDIQAILSPKHLLTASVVAFSLRTEFADANTLVPQSASSNSNSKGAYASLSDNYQFSSGTLVTMFRYTHFDSNAYGQGLQDMLITPDGVRGNAFNSWNRKANQFEALPMFRLARKTWLGSHDLTVGANVVHRSYTGASHSRPVLLLREDGSLAERIDFRGPGRLDGADTETSEFVQDHWSPTDRLAVDSGIRVSNQSNGRSAAFAPRTGLAYALDKSNKTVFHAGAGLFYDRVPLLAATFPQNPIRVVSFYDQAGLIVGGPQVFQNAYVDQAGGAGAISNRRDPGTSPRNFTWSLGVDRKLRSNVTLKLSFLQSATSNIFLVNPQPEAPQGNSVLGLAPTGNSHYREFQTAVHYRIGQLGEMNVAYIRSRARGDLNTLTNTFVPFEQPVIRPSVNAYLASDVPDRLLTSGTFHLPWKVTASPVVDLHPGFRYSQVDVLQNYVGTPNSQRFPTFFSLNLKLYKDFTLPDFVGPVRGYRFRLGMFALNLTNHLNPHDVFNNVASPDFGHFVGFQHKVYGVMLDLIK